jgi:ParB family transcriptional regulator, chromosome partitioning protein
MNKKASAFAALTADLEADSGFDSMLSADALTITVSLDDIEIQAQEREEFEDEDNTLAELAQNMQEKGQLQPIGIRPVEGGAKPYVLIFGERRTRAARLAGHTDIQAKVFNVTAEQAEDLRLAENIQRKNLTQLEEARRLKKDVDSMGMEGAMARHNKSRAWFSKRLALLSLPPTAARLLTEQISADPEVIHAAATVEKNDPAAAEALVDDLKATRGKESAREKAKAAKDAVKPGKKKAEAAGSKGKDTPAAASRSNTEGSLATSRDTSNEAPGAANVTAWPYPTSTPNSAGENAGEAQADEEAAGAPTLFAPAELLTRAYVDIFERSKAPKKVLDGIAKEDRETITSWLRPFYEAGVHSNTVSHHIAQNLRKGLFATDNEGWFAMAAFLEGVASDSNFDLLNILGSAKA